jgi:hypothetical protein
MAGIDDAFWNQLDARIAAIPASATAPRPRAAIRPARAPRPLATEEAAPERHQVADWTGLVDTISKAGAAAHEQNAAYESLAADLSRALADVERYKALVAQAAAKTREIQALADARIEAIQLRADARVQRAEERAEMADQRVVVVEDWLAQFEQASRALLPNAPKQTGRFSGSAAA